MTSFRQTLSFIVQGIRILGLNLVMQRILYPLRATYHARRLGQRSAPPPRLDRTDYTLVGNLHAYRVDGGTITLACDNARLCLTLLAPDLIRVRLHPNISNIQYPFSYSIAKPDADWSPVEFTLKEHDDALEIRTSRLTCRVTRSPCRLAFYDPDGTLIRADEAGMGWHAPSGAVACWQELGDDERVYGLGQRGYGLDHRGRAFELWNQDPQVYQPGQDPLNFNVPFWVGLVGGRGYGLFFDNSFRGQVDLGVEAPGVGRFGADGGEMRYYFFYGPALTTVLERYTELTGRMPLPPLWTLGYHQSRWSYSPEARVRQVAAQLRARRIPCDSLHLDIHYMDGYRCFTWHPRRFPDPARLLADLREQGFKPIAIIDPGIKTDRRYAVCREGLAQDVFCKYPDGRLFVGPVWPGNCYFPDFSSPRARAWWGGLYRALLDDVAPGLAGVWNDMNEPVVMNALQGDTIPDFVRHDLEGQGGDHRQVHNVYGMLMARATYEGLSALRPDERPYVLSRSGWAGVQRYAYNWTGDNESTWAQLRLSIPMLLNLGLSGMAFTGPDVGGFSGVPGAELLARWTQLGAFLPYFRNHTMAGTPDQEPWAFDARTETICRQAIEMRYRLLPYLYTAFWQCARTGLPIMRPLFLTFQDDPATYALEDQFMLGDVLLVAPVVEPGATSRQVYLPPGLWYDFDGPGQHTGGQTISVAAPDGHIPVFVRAGSVLPTWPSMQFVGERQVEAVTLRVYPGTGGGASWLYEDDGRSRAHERGDWRLTRFEVERDGEQWTLRRRSQGDYGPGYERFEVTVSPFDREPRQVPADFDEIVLQ
jgi:alpha-glucosidase